MIQASHQVSQADGGNIYDKYYTRNPVARWLMMGFRRNLRELLALTGSPKAILEVGCGEGEVTALLAKHFPEAELLGTDLSSSVIAEARRRHPHIRFEGLGIEELGALEQRFDLVVAAEVLEHLDDPEGGLEHIIGRSRQYVLATVPREPLWRALNCARGAYLSAWGNTPGHVQHWGGNAFCTWFGKKLEVVAHRHPVPWTQALGRVRHPKEDGPGRTSGYGNTRT